MQNRVSFATIAALNLLTIYLVVVFEYHHLHDENHLFENLQVLLLCLCVLGSSLLLRGSNRDLFVWAGLGLLGFSFLLRELDLERLPLPELIQLLGSGSGRIALLGALWLALGAAFVMRQADKQGLLQRFAGGPVFACLALASLLLLGSAVMDKELLPFTHPRLLEELFEINAYAFMAWPALRCFRPFGQAPAVKPV